MTPDKAQTATPTEIQDWLCKEDGWTYFERIYHEDPDSGWRRKNAPDEARGGYDNILDEEDHPFPLTIDGAAAALPQNLRIRIEQLSDGWRGDVHLDNGEKLVSLDQVPDEITLRYRLAVLARLELKARGLPSLTA